jgi:hypothetical protein
VTQWRVVDMHTDPAALGPLGDDENAVRITETLTHARYEAIAELLGTRPEVMLWVDNQGAPDLRMLRFFPGLRRLRITNAWLTSWEGLHHVAETLEWLFVDSTLKRLSIAPIGDLDRLRLFGLEGPVRHAETIARLDTLEDLRLRSVTMPDLSPLGPMRHLRSLYVGLGGTTDLSVLPDLPALEELELWRIRGLRDLSPIGGALRLRTLHLQAMGGVTALPSMRGLRKLRRVVLDAMKGIVDLRPVAEAPALEELLLASMCQLEPDAVRPLIGHRTLRNGIWGLCSDRKDVEAWELLPFGDPPLNYERWRTRDGGRRRARLD